MYIKFGFLTPRFRWSNSLTLSEGPVFGCWVMWLTPKVMWPRSDYSPKIEEHFDMYLVLIAHCMTEIAAKEWKSGDSTLLALGTVLRSKVLARNTSEKANMLMFWAHRKPFSRTYEARELLEGQLVNQALSQRLTTEAEDQQAANTVRARALFVSNLRTRVR